MEVAVIGVSRRDREDLKLCPQLIVEQKRLTAKTSLANR